MLRIWYPVSLLLLGYLLVFPGILPALPLPQYLGVPQNSKSYYANGLARFKANDLSGAKDNFSLMLKQDPGHSDSLIGLALCDLVERQYDQAKLHAKRAISLHQKNPRYYAVLGKIYLATGEYLTAKTTLAQAVALAPDKNYLRMELASAHISLREYGSAKAEYRMILRDDPAHIGARSALARLLAEQGLENLAIAEYQEIIRFHPDNPLPHYLIGKRYLQSKNHQAALKHFRSAVDLDSGFLYAQLGIGDVYYLDGDYERASSNYTKILERKEEFAPAHLKMGMVYEATDRIEQAIGEYERTFALDPQSPLAPMKLVEVHAFKRGDLEKARGYANVLQEYMPDEPAIRELLDRLQSLEER